MTQREEFEAWWEEFSSAHEDWRFADSDALRWATWQAAQAAQPPAPSDTAREYMTSYSDCKEWAGAANQAQPSQALELELELSDAEIKKISSDLPLYEDYRPESCQADYLDPVKFARAIIAAINAKGA